MTHDYTSHAILDPHNIATMRGVSLHIDPRPVDAAAEALARSVRAALASDVDAFVNVALPGGSALAAWPAAARLLGEALVRVRLTWVDERCVPPSDADSNRGATLRAMADAGVAPPAEQLSLWLDHETPDEALARVRAGLAAWGGRLDVTLLGMGPDGHIASLYPGHDWDGELVRYVEDSPKPPAMRMTLTRPLLATARASILLATGASKREALAALVAGKSQLPAAGLPGLHIFTNLDISPEHTP